MRVLAFALMMSGVAAGAAAEDMVRPGDNLVIQDIPEIPAALARRLAQYQNMRSATFQDWLPGDGGMLVLTRFADTAQVHQVPAPGARRTQLTFLDERVGWARHCRRKGCGYFLFGMDVGGSEFYQIFRFDKTSGRHVLLTDGKSRNVGLRFSRAGDRVAYASTRRNGRDFDIYLMDPEKPADQKMLFEASGMWFPVDFSPDGRTLLVERFTSINESHLVLVDIPSGKRTPLTPPDEKLVSYREARFSRDGKRIYFTTDRDWEFVRLAYVETGKKEFAPTYLTTHIEWDVEAFELSMDGRSIAFAVNEGGFSRLYWMSTRGGKARKIRGAPAGVATGGGFQQDGRLLAFGMTGSRTPGDVYVYDPKKKRVERWTYSETGGLDAGRFVEPEIITYPTFDKEGGEVRKIPALAYLPPKAHKPPYPVLISIHGGPEGQARPYFQGMGNYRIQEMGVAVIKPNVRGSTGYGKSYLLLDNGKLRENTVRDIGALLDWLKTRPDLDEKRVAVSGGSYGGYMSLASMVTYGERLRCGIDYVGISSFVTFLENTQDYRRDWRRKEYGDERDPNMRIFLDMISPLTNAHRIKIPVLVAQGQNDPRVPASESEQIVQKIKKNQVPVWYLLARDEGHGFGKKKNRDYLGLVIVRFLEEFLLK